jgi:hypothetical protein
MVKLMQWPIAIFPYLLPAIFLVTATAILVSFHLGAMLGRRATRCANPEPQVPMTSLVSGTLSLLAFVLGFTFGLASSHSDSRDDTLYAEALAIGVAYHRTDLLPLPARDVVRSSILEYLDLRVETTRSPEFDKAVFKLRKLQQRIWTEAIGDGDDAGGPAPPSLLVQSLNDVIHVHGERALAEMRSRISTVVWSVLCAITVLAVAAAGYYHGLYGGRRSFPAVAYAFILALVIVMIIDLDTPQFGRLKANHQAFVDLRERLTLPPR